MYIRILQPKYNINGKIKQFQFHPNVKKSEELMSHLEDGRNEEKTTAQPRSTEHTTAPQSKQSKQSTQSALKTSQPTPSTSNPNDLLQYCLAKQDKYTASIPANWLTKAQLKELVDHQYERSI